ncbi:MAG: hypothetical protein A3G33_06580 [Omnitrophica bacterium RIFCSPLOWO2_12_FULL_44_17]|uniref:Helix-turn-helix domain-containing protein n=1 Tax=Candidatus Danuiimicrobium aquiferis TaxID=1801832 RepID=A0A1G1KSF8_9BACT|nr:MAG: hypothetical protein A3E74_04000 [Omnitrophica bacterium RIFCSPHIGHO2_12_FULL_44_12]OGW95489.1 MAG: hypothetical protein A3G33_06580 [Omnitrophica bacterium RIFCSPLOWO2_12_FULL_44_17]OGX01852.1 MAG: hypothetical protein A3J12_09915 [Omnitrophica bacterium RIFCSPLOWO2_02_FULL_44_11]
MAKKKNEEKILDVDARMQGTIVFKDPVNLRINGSFEGKLDTRGNLMIGENANVKADIKGDKIIIAGKVFGNLIASSSISIIAPGMVQGEIRTPSLSVAEGAIIDGRCVMLNVSHSEPGEIMELREVAQYLEVEAKVVEEWANQKLIPAEFEDGEFKFYRGAVDKWLQDEKIKK